MQWHFIAESLSATVAEAKQRVTSTAFADYGKFMTQRYNEHEKLDYYLAKIIAEIKGLRDAVLKQGVRGARVEVPDLKDQFIKFEFKSNQAQNATTEAHKASWLAAVGATDKPEDVRSRTTSGINRGQHPGSASRSRAGRKHDRPLGEKNS